jgi:hypothetical protein
MMKNGEYACVYAYAYLCIYICVFVCICMHVKGNVDFLVRIAGKEFFYDEEGSECICVCVCVCKYLRMSVVFVFCMYQKCACKRRSF